MPKHKPIKFETTLKPKKLEEIKQIIKDNKNAKTVINVALALIAVGGILTVGAIAPNALGGFLRMYKNSQKAKKEKYNQIWRGFNALKKQRAIEFVREENNCLVYRLNKKGEEKIEKFVFEELRVGIPNKWDKNWRLVIFDIPETKKMARKALTRKLKELDFYQCQKSVWIHPFPCWKEIEFIKDVFNIKPFVKIFLVKEMTDGKTLYHFKNLLKKVVAK